MSTATTAFRKKHIAEYMQQTHKGLLQKEPKHESHKVKLLVSFVLSNPFSLHLPLPLLKGLRMSILCQEHLYQIQDSIKGCRCSVPLLLDR